MTDDYLKLTIINRLDELRQARNIRSLTELASYDPLLRLELVEHVLAIRTSASLSQYVDVFIRIAEVLDANPLWLVFDCGNRDLPEAPPDDCLERRINDDFRESLRVATRFASRWPHTTSRLLTLWRELDLRRQRPCSFPQKYAAASGIPITQEQMGELWNLLFPRNRE